MITTSSTPKVAQGRVGQHIAMVRFGSRVNCDIPAGFELKAGDKVSTASTILTRNIEVTSDE